MVVNLKYIFVILTFIYLTEPFCQEEVISEKKHELSEIQSEIVSLENELKVKSKLEKKSNSTLENYNKQNHLLNKLITGLRKEEREKQNQIIRTSSQIKTIESEIEKIRDNYSKYVVAIYKKGQITEVEAIVESASLQQAIYRAEYLKKFSDKRKDDLDELKVSIALLETKKKELEVEKQEKAKLVAQKQKEENQLKKKLNERKKILSAIRSDKKVIKNSLDAKKEAHKQIESMIAGLIEESRRKKSLEIKQKQILASGDGTIINESELYEDSPVTDYDLVTADFVSFSDLKGKMIWPLNKGTIFKKFGESKNKTLNTVTINYGVDIKAKKDENVRCVADGVVSAIDWLPGYGSIVILTHKDEYRTVYGHLSEIFVSEGDKVKTGGLLAKVGESLDGKVLHFEIWSSRSNQNPENWLKK